MALRSARWSPDEAVYVVEAFLPESAERVRMMIARVLRELEDPDSEASRMLEARVRSGALEHDYQMFREDPGLRWFRHEIREELVDAVVYAAVQEYHRRRYQDGAEKDL